MNQDQLPYRSKTRYTYQHYLPCGKDKRNPIEYTDDQLHRWEEEDRADFIADMVVLGLVAVSAVLLFAYIAGVL